MASPRAVTPYLAFWAFLFAGAIQLDVRDPWLRRARATLCLVLWSVAVVCVGLASDMSRAAIGRDAGTTLVAGALGTVAGAWLARRRGSGR